MPTDHAKVKELFLAVLEMPAAERAAYLSTACAADTALREQLEIMLQSQENSGELLPRPPAELLADSSATDADATAALAPAHPGSATSAEAGPTDGAESLSFLEPSNKPGHLGRLGRYEIQEVIGKGGFGIVLKGFDERLHRVVAIKVLSPAYAANGSARKRFIREAQTAAAIKNEHVVGIYDVEKDAQPPYLAMEMIDGVSLQDKLDKHGPLSVKEILRIGVQMADGLAAAHKQGLVHRDIKPANILLENGVERVKITDFGLARSVDDASVTQSGTVAGTPMYMSPEQAEGLPVDHRSDLFSLGTVLYAMCTGHSPFRASGTHAVLKRVIDASPRPMREVNSEVPDWLCAIIARLHAKKPENRFQTAKEVAELLGARLADVQAGRVIHSEPIHGQSLDAVSPAASAKKYGRLPMATKVTALTIALVGLGLVGTAYALPTPSSAGTLFALVGIALCLIAGTILVMALVTASRWAKFVKVSLVSGLFGIASVPVWQHLLREPQTVDPLVANPHLVPVFGSPGWRQLSDGKDWSGWKSYAGKLETRENLPRNFHLRMEAVLYNGASGIVFRAHPDDVTEENSRWFVNFSENAVGRVALSEGFRPANPRISQDLNLTGNNPKCGEWFSVEIVAKDDSTEVRINEWPVTTFKHPNDVPGAGVLRLSHSGEKAPIAFRNIEIKDLTPITFVPDRVPRPDGFVNTLGIEFARIPKGKAWLGGGENRPGDKQMDFKDDFFLGTYEVTQEEWEKVMGQGTNPSHFARVGEKNADVFGVTDADLKRFPVENVSWDDAQRFIDKLNVLDTQPGWTYRLPTLAEWEYACRGGPMADASDSAFDFYLQQRTNQLLSGQANYRHANSPGRTCKVGTYPPNKLGLYDMHGNVSEWCADEFPPDPKDATGKVRHVHRGGCWYLGPEWCRASIHSSFPPSPTKNDRGFRVARVPSRPETAKTLAELEADLKAATEKRERTRQRQTLGLASMIDVFDADISRDEADLAVLKVKLKNNPLLDKGYESIVRSCNARWKLWSDLVKDGKAIQADADNAEKALRAAEAQRNEARKAWGLPPIAPMPTTPPIAVAPFDAAKAKEHQDAWAKHLGVEVEIKNSLGMKLRLIPPGEFMMGSSPEEIPDAIKDGVNSGLAKDFITRLEKSSLPQHKVRLSQPFRIGTCEVTVEAFRTFVKETGHRTANEQKAGDISNWQSPGWNLSEKQPVTHVSWDDAQEFCRWLSRREGRRYVLPTEAQWEFACRAGSQGRWTFGDDPALLGDYAWYGMPPKSAPAEVGQKRANAFGLFDMHGNAQEWCLDWHESSFYGQSRVLDPVCSDQEKVDAVSHVLRGGWWRRGPQLPRSAARSYGMGDVFLQHGFRVAIVGDLKATTKASWVPLFNGKDLKGWVSQMKNPKEVNPDRAWEVLDNILIARGTPEGVLRTEKVYHRYILEMECQASQPDPGWAGALLFHMPVPDPGLGSTPGMMLRIEPGRQGFFAPLAGVKSFALRPVDWRTFKPDWNQLRFESTDDRFEIMLNGNSVLKFTEFAGGFPPGYFGIMSAGHGMRYRNIRIKDLMPPPTEPGWVQLFNGKDLTGWEGLTGLWKIKGEDEIGSTSGADGTPPSSFLVSKRSFKDFEIRYQVRLKGEKGSGGLQIRSNLVDRKTFDVNGPRVIIQRGFWSYVFVAYKEGLIGRFLARAPDEIVTRTVKPLGFNEFHVRCVGKHLTVKVNGETTIDGDFPDLADEGVVALLVESGNPLEVTFRNVEIKELPPAEPGWVQLFNSKDLTGWKTLPGKKADTGRSNLASSSAAAHPNRCCSASPGTIKISI